MILLIMVLMENGMVIDTKSYSAPPAEFEKESCSRRRRPSYPPSHLPPSPAPPVVRYRHRESGRYLCFTRRGKIRTYVSTRCWRGYAV